MRLYEGIKDVAKVVQQADNVDLYKKLLDLSEQALDMQAEIAALKEENIQLKKEKEQSDDIVYHNTNIPNSKKREYPYITLASDKENIRYCAVCWGLNHKLIPLYNEFNCMLCNDRRRATQVVF